MFENLSERLQDTFRKISGKGKISEDNIKDALREVRRALLEADVNLKVVKGFIKNVKENAIGQEVIKSVSPGQQFIKIVNDEMIALMGGDNEPLQTGEKSPTIYMMVGLQGAGKTTTSAKLALHLRKQGKRPLLVAADIYRPAAIKQLEVLGKQINIPVFNLGQIDPVEITEKAIEYANENGHDYIILDTAGRLHIDLELMDELVRVSKFCNPSEVLLVVDSMIGQDAVKMSESFNDSLGITGVIITKLDGDTRGGAALSIKSVTGKPIKFMTTGEKLDALELFHPERISSRILGMGDVLTLIEKAQENMNIDDAKLLEKKFRKNDFTLEDFMQQMKQVQRLGPLENIIGMIPGIGGKINSEDLDKGKKEMKKIEAMISSMTISERQKPEIISASRKLRISKGSGSDVKDVSKLLKNFGEMKKMMKSFSSSGLFDMGKNKKMAKRMETMMKTMGKKGGLPQGGADMFMGQNLTNFKQKK